MSEPERPTCGSCPYFGPYSGNDQVGSCQRRPPVVFRNEKVGTTSYFPEVEADEWCGEHPGFRAYIVALELYRLEPAD